MSNQTDTEATPMEALLSLVNRPSFATIANGMTELRAAFIDDRRLFAHIDALHQIMPRLKAVANKVQELEAAQAAKVSAPAED